ncbi:CRTAC1 family protein [Planctomyces sp. SH-PL62]|uniref:CRTAC1 family protein n=1 Tax=Planctomyces sp. SH-PL62 TaxID=1636152 RepID=UPI00078D57F7|nr:CRTAC1 family protein [Planctomyces sp. SH-PL62]AMV39257.1 ASPIC and UnbV [Planctomyces sp. SH-PL62]
MMLPLRTLLAAALPILLSACGEPTAKAPDDPTPPVNRNIPAPPPVGPAVPRFVEVAASAGLTTVLYGGGPDKDHILESVGSGCGFVDYDGDGRLDVYLVNAWALDEEPSRVRLKGRNALYRNRGDGKFEDVTDKAHVADESWGCGVSAADYDDDGHVDLYVTNFGPNRLYRNRGDGTFEQVAERAGVADPGWGAGSSFFDADGDGDLDLYVANYIDTTMDEVLAARRTTVWREKVKVLSGPFGLRGGRDRFYRNNGDGTFSDATDEVGMTDTAEAYGLGVLTSDLDDDGDVDVFVTNDSNPNFLYRNNGDGTFTEVGTWSGAGVNGHGAAQADMGVDAADYDGDGRPDILVTTFAQDAATIYHNDGDLAFQDVAALTGLKAITYQALKWGCAYFDYDHDADVDVVIVNGHIYPQVDQAPELNESYRQLPFLIRNDLGKLTDVSREAGPGFQVAASARGLAVGDYDDDGDLDLLITAMDSPPLLLRNDTPRSGNWLKLRLLNAHGSPAIGARATITAGGKVQHRELRSGSSHQSQNALELHLGVGEAATVDRVEIDWPGRGRSSLEQVESNQTVTIRHP